MENKIKKLENECNLVYGLGMTSDADKQMWFRFRLFLCVGVCLFVCFVLFFGVCVFGGWGICLGFLKQKCMYESKVACIKNVDTVFFITLIFSNSCVM